MQVRASNKPGFRMATARLGSDWELQHSFHHPTNWVEVKGRLTVNAFRSDQVINVDTQCPRQEQLGSSRIPRHCLVCDSFSSGQWFA